MAITKQEREQLKQRYNGHCAYCGEKLGKIWHADHLEPVRRQSTYKRGKGYVPTGKLDYPARDTLANLMPACPPCNISKYTFGLEQWRRNLEHMTSVLTSSSTTYRHAVRFGTIVETHKPVVFYFERLHTVRKRLTENHSQ